MFVRSFYGSSCRTRQGRISVYSRTLNSSVFTRTQTLPKVEKKALGEKSTVNDLCMTSP